MGAVITAFLSLLQILAPGATSPVIAQIIQILTALIPILIKEYQDLLPIAQAMIEALKQNGDITQDQWNALDDMSAQYDAEFQAALAAAKAQDQAAAAAKVAKP